MSDVEKICDLNHRRARWAAEYADTEDMDCFPTERENTNDQKREMAMRTAARGCAMFTGMGAAFVGMGLASMHMPTLIVGATTALVFLLSGLALDAKADETMEEVTCL